jgi:TolB-like protein
MTNPKFGFICALVSILALSAIETHAQPAVYVSSGKRVINKYPFAGGTSCCGCRVKHYGKLPADFPARDVEAVTFYLNGSRSNSYYKNVKAGPTKLRFVFGDKESIASSVQLPDFEHHPVKHKWFIKFLFDPPVSAGPGTKWQLLDGDNNIYSAVFVHSSDNDDEGGLPGIDEQTGCQYTHRVQSRYSARFDFAGSVISVPRKPDKPKMTDKKKVRKKVFKTAVVEFTERGDLGIQDAGAIVAEWMTTSLNNTGAFEVYERLSLAKLMAEHKLEMSGLMDEETIAEIGRIHGVQAIVTGSVLKFGDIISVTAKVIEVETAKIIDSADIKVNNVNAISSEMERLAWELAAD